MTLIPLLSDLAGVSAFSTLAGFNVCTYAGADDVETDLRALEAATGISRDRIYLPVQTHSATVRLIAPGVDLSGVDGVVCTEPDALIGVHTADCLPLLMADTRAGVIAAVHCGWRGTVAGIVDNALRAMVAAGADPARIAAAMGPCICPDCFEVGEEVARLFPDAAVSRRPGLKPRVDLARAVALTLRAAGVRSVAPPPACSKCNPTLYSVRRQGSALPFRTLTALRLLPQPQTFPI